MKFDINEYKGKYVMHCKTEEEARDFCNYLHSVGRTWISMKSYLSETKYYMYKENTVYYFNENVCSNISAAETENYTILEWSIFMNNTFTKADLKDGMVVEYRDGRRRMVLDNKVIGHNHYNSLDVYSNTLETHPGDITIDKVYKSTSYTLADYFKTENLTLIWERKEVEEMTLAEVCKLLGKEIKIIQ